MHAFYLLVVENKETKGCAYDLDMVPLYKVAERVTTYLAHPYHQANLPPLLIRMR